ncbi:MAG: M24 family metallopeptidase [Aeromicrobium sp.]
MTTSFFNSSELDSRVARTRQEMDTAGLAALVVASPEDVYYLTGLNHQGHFALTALVVPDDGPLLLVARAMEAPTITAQVPQCVHVPYADDQDPATVLADAVRSVAAAGSEVGVEQTSMSLPVSVWEPLQTTLDTLRLVDGSGIVWRLRQVKSPAEVRCVRQAAEASSRAMEAGLAAVKDGVPQHEVVAAVYEEMILAAKEYPAMAPLIRSRDTLLQEHVGWDDRLMASGDALFFELSASVGRYHAPLTRMAYLGEPPPGTEVAAAISTAGLEAVRGALRPGALATDVYDAWQAVVDEGLGHSSYRRHHCGYLIGIGFPPTWTGGAEVVGLRSGSDLEICEGMTFHVLSWLLDQEPADFVLSDTMLVTADGGEILTTTRRDPIVV